VRDDDPGNHGFTEEQVVDVSYMLERPEARSILRGFWSKRLLKASPALAVLVIVYVRAIGPPYAVSVLTGLLLCSLTWIGVMAIWDHGKLKVLCRRVRVRWSPAGVQVANPLGTKQFHWSEVAGCKVTNRFVSTTFSDGQVVHVPRRAFKSDAETDRILKLAEAAALIDVKKPAVSDTPIIDVRKPTDP
jgi:hypothetical protein